MVFSYSKDTLHGGLWTNESQIQGLMQCAFHIKQVCSKPNIMIIYEDIPYLYRIIHHHAYFTKY